ncbi:MAG: hypothetical protein FJ117_07410 [Deltaproteobacteria bacterium]|nr:hypothetical protein [Deltaproteobacteria bacterium]
MPLFRFKCKSCGSDFEAFLRLSEVQAGARCSECGSSQVEKPLQHPPSPTSDTCSLNKKT